MAATSEDSGGGGGCGGGSHQNAEDDVKLVCCGVLCADLGGPQQIAFDGDNNILAACENDHRVKVISKENGSVLDTFGSGVKGSGAGQLSWPYGVGIGRKHRNHMYICDTYNHRIVVYDRVKRDVVRMFGSRGSGPGQCIAGQICLLRPGVEF
jgi:DNA-binding beta-propeller fold protein YncE